MRKLGVPPRAPPPPTSLSFFHQRVSAKTCVCWSSIRRAAFATNSQHQHQQQAAVTYLPPQQPQQHRKRKYLASLPLPTPSHTYTPPPLVFINRMVQPAMIRMAARRAVVVCGARTTTAPSAGKSWGLLFELGQPPLLFYCSSSAIVLLRQVEKAAAAGWNIGTKTMTKLRHRSRDVFVVIGRVFVVL